MITIFYSMQVNLKVDAITNIIDITSVLCRLKSGYFITGRIVQYKQDGQQPYLLVKGEKLKDVSLHNDKYFNFEEIEKGKFSLGGGTQIINISGKRIEK